jgi:hypothetical protein
MTPALFKTMRAICRSPAVGKFVVGITAAPSARRGSYRRVGIPNFVVLAMGFAQKRALQIEAALQAACFKQEDTRSKYHLDKLDKPHRKSVGGSKRYSKSRAYSIYMAWW